MKHFLFFLAILFSSIGMQSQVRITEVVSSGGTSDWFELTNYGTTAVDITGWKVDDSSFGLATSFLLNGVTSIAPNERVMFCENASASYAATFRTFWGLAPSVQVGTYTGTQIGLSSSGDGVIVFNASGTEVWRVSFGAATAGTSFYWGYTSSGSFDPMYVGASNVGLLSTLGTIQSQVTVNSADVAMNVGSPSTSIQPVNPVTGCMDALACNYNSTATTSDNSCTYGLTYYLDQDGDGYGVSTTSIVSCTATAGYVLSSTDCDDNVAAISPGASENCANSIDDNCDGLVNTGCPQAEVSIASASNFIQLNENAGTVTIPVTVTNANSLPINVQFSLSVYSNATEGVDYTWTNTMTIQPLTNGVSNHTITLVDDALIENAERVVVKIASTDNGVVNATNNYRIVFIKDNEQENIASSNELNLTLLNSFSNGTSGSNSAEIVAHDAQSQRLFIANSIAGKMDIVNFSNPAAPVLLSSISMSPYGNINSIAVYNGIVAVAIENTNPQANGKIVFFDTNGVFLNEVPAGAMPDMITFSKDYTKVITANEGEPNGTYSVDPEGSITVVDISGGIANLTSANATQIMLTQFNGQEVALRAQGIRIFTTSATVAQDLEPEYVAVSDDNTKAYVTLQENNAILVLNLVTNTIESLLPLGYADYSAGSGNSLDASDQSGAILNTSDLPIKGAYMPDAISYSTINGSGYVFMANEGDSREFGSVTDANRISSSTFNSLDATAFPDAAILRNNKFLGRLSALKYSGDTDGDGDYDELHVLGSRSFTIRNAATNALVFDSKDMFEKITANSPLTSAFFNASNSTGAATSKNRSDDKGPEPEGVTVSVINGIHYAFIGLERVGGCMVFNVENPNTPVFVTYVNNRTLNGSGPDLGAEGIIFISAADSPNGQPMVILANEVSSTLSIFGVACPTLSYYADADGDTYGDASSSVQACTLPIPAGYVSNSTDCNDANAAVNPGATEVCNGTDDDCSGVADDGLTFTDYYADVDGDTYGDAGTSIQACTSPAGYVADNTDCDDNNAAVNPVGVDICGNGIDEDCSGSDCPIPGCTDANACNYDASATTDDGSCLIASLEYFYDNDGDGYGDPLSGSLFCTPQDAPWSLTNTDCDDFDNAINPAATEICNGMDDNCNGTADDGLVFEEYFVDVDADGYGVPTSNYVISPLAFELLTPDVAPANAGPSCDDCTTQIPIGFTFPFYENTYTNLEISSNGFVSFDLINESGCCDGEIIPSLDYVNNIIALGWYDLAPENGEITYFNLSNPNRLVIEYSNAPEFDDSGVLSGQIVLFESGEIQLIYSNLSAADHIITAGVENANGTLAAAIPGFNSQVNSISNVAYQLVYTTSPTVPGISSCSVLAGYALNNTDCNDNNAAVNSGATEICNSIDDNCDTQIDEGVQSTFYADVDGDTYGDASSSVQGCTASVGYVSNSTDCNDANAAVNPGATEVCNGTDDDCSGVADDGLTFTDYYADLDLDGYGAGAATNACAQPVGYVLTNTDCNNFNAAVNPTATESCSTAFDDNCNGIVNEGCSAIAGDNPSNATSMTTSIWPNCNAVNGTLVNATASGSAQTVCLTGEDKWHQFVATSEGISIVVNSSAADILIELQTAAGVLVAQENAVDGLGGETLNHYGLTAGQVYKIGVRNYNSALGTGTYSICAKMLKRGGCDYGPGPYTLCQYFKASWAGATGTSYTFTYTGVSGPADGNVYTRTQTSDICVLSTVLPTLPYGSTYNVLITNTYTLNNGAGVAEIISVPGLAPCSMSTATQPVTALRVSNQCAAGPRFRGAIVASLPWVCGSTNWRWEFTELDPQGQPVGLPITVNRGAASNYINLGSVLQLQYGKTYSVRTAPILAYTGSDYQWGAPVCMSIVGTAGLIADGQDASESTSKVEIANEVNMNLYPNPTHGTDVNINLSGVTSENVQIRVVDAMGRQVWSNRYSVDGVLNTNITFERPLANGLYFVEAIFNGEVQTQRMMVQK